LNKIYFHASSIDLRISHFLGEYENALYNGSLLYFIAALG